MMDSHALKGTPCTRRYWTLGHMRANHRRARAADYRWCTMKLYKAFGDTLHVIIRGVSHQQEEKLWQEQIIHRNGW